MTVRVVVADDQAPFRRVVRSVLEATAGFELVSEATSGEQSLRLVQSLRPDIVLMDIQMPGIGGIEAARTIATAYPSILTILLSTYREEDLPSHARSCGAAAYLRKSEFSERALRSIWAARL